MKLLLILLFSFGLSSEWGTSVSLRTPNDNTHPLDYELSIKLDDNEGKFKYHLKRDWERELGEKYIDDVIKIQHQFIGNIYLISEEGISKLNLTEKKEDSFYKNKFKGNLEIYYEDQIIYLKDDKSLFKLSE